MSSNARTGSTPVAGSREFGEKSLLQGVFRYYYINQKVVQLYFYSRDRTIYGQDDIFTEGTDDGITERYL